LCESLTVVLKHRGKLLSNLVSINRSLATDVRGLRTVHLWTIMTDILIRQHTSRICSFVQKYYGRGYNITTARVDEAC